MIRSTACTICEDPAAAALEIVAAPIFNDSTGGSNWCLKQCPACRALFEWEHVYTYLVTGSEDDTYVSRLDASGARRAVQKLFLELRRRSRSSEPPRTTLLPEVFGADRGIPIDQQGTSYPTFPIMDELRAREPVRDDELAVALDAHARFVAGGGDGGGWKTALSSDLATAVLFAFYGCPAGASAEYQAHFDLAWLVVPSGRRLELRSANLLGVRCVQQDLDGADLAGALLVAANLAGTSLRGATLARADCSGARLAGCDLRDADLRETDLERSDLTGADLRGARLDGASFLNACTIGVRR